MRLLVASIYPAASSVSRPVFQANAAVYRKKPGGEKLGKGMGKQGGMAPAEQKKSGRLLRHKNKCNKMLIHATVSRLFDTL